MNLVHDLLGLLPLIVEGDSDASAFFSKQNCCGPTNAPRTPRDDDHPLAQPQIHIVPPSHKPLPAVLIRFMASGKKAIGRNGQFFPTVLKFATPTLHTLLHDPADQFSSIFDPSSDASGRGDPSGGARR